MGFLLNKRTDDSSAAQRSRRADRTGRGTNSSAQRGDGEELNEAHEWFRSRTFQSRSYDRNALVEAKKGQRVSLVMPARNEAATVGILVESFRRELMLECPLIDELIVIDSGSTDDTFDIASRAGAHVYRQSEVLSHLGDRSGKGEALWKSLAVATGDVVVFCDSDLRDADPQLVVGLIGPILTDPAIKFVKACYERALDDGTTIHPAGGGRVTELVARPLLNMWWPQMSGIIQPLAGEYAARREVFASIPFAGRYGVEIAMLIDVFHRWGLNSMAQVDSGVRKHRNSADAVLGVMAAELQSVVLSKLQQHGLITQNAPTSSNLRQFERRGGHFVQLMSDVSVGERPPMCEVVGALSTKGVSST